MPSIRRNLLGYLLLLIALSLGAVGLLVDRYAQAAMRAREAAETKRIEEAYKVQEKEALAKFDAELLAEAQLMGRETLRARLLSPSVLGTFRDGPGAAVRPPDEEVQAYQRRIAALIVGQSPAGDGFAAFTALALARPADPAARPSEPSRTLVGPPMPSPPPAPRPAGPPGDGPPRLGLSPLWIGYESPRVIPRIQEAFHRSFEEDDRGHRGEFQVSLVISDPAHKARHTLTARSAGLTHDLPLDVDAIERAGHAEPGEPAHALHDDVQIPGKGEFRRVAARGPSAVRGNPPDRPQPPWLLPLSQPVLNPTGGSGPRPGLRLSDLQLRLYVQCLLPRSVLDDRLRAERAERDEQLTRVQAETRIELAQLRTKLVLIGCGTFAALVLGGWFIVARGLSPVRKLSDAVSRVSEKDFRLPVRDDELSRELVPIHSRLTQTLDLLRRAFAREKQAVADISHELRTPIASLLATLDVALRKPRTQEQYRSTLEDCRTITRQLSQLVERIMTLASLDAGTARTNHSRVDAFEVIAGCAAVIRPLAAAHDLTLETHAEPPLELDTDPDKLREVLVNLLHNAVEYNRPQGKIELHGRRDNGRIVLEVRDTGIGMAAEVRERIFERFFRADPSRHATGVHAGLGLAIVKEYVGRLGGTIAVESEPGAGSTFRIELPAAPEESAEEPAPPAPPARDARPEARTPPGRVRSGS